MPGDCIFRPVNTGDQQQQQQEHRKIRGDTSRDKTETETTTAVQGDHLFGLRFFCVFLSIQRTQGAADSLVCAFVCSLDETIGRSARMQGTIQRSEIQFNK